MLRNDIARRIALALFGLTVCLASPSSAQQTVGNATSTTNNVEGVSRGGSPRPIKTGSQVYLNELVRTGEAAVARLVFLDDTDLRVGPRSEVTLDRFVYNPDRDAGSVIVRAARGIFRFFTGSQRPQNYLIQTPIASIGVRGTVFDLLVLQDRVTVILVEGEIRVTTFRGRVIPLTRPGQSVTVYATGAVDGPKNWRGTVRVQSANARFPYFGGTETPDRSGGRPGGYRPPKGPKKPDVYTRWPKRHGMGYPDGDRGKPGDKGTRHPKYPKDGKMGYPKDGKMGYPKDGKMGRPKGSSMSGPSMGGYGMGSGMSGSGMRGSGGHGTGGMSGSGMGGSGMGSLGGYGMGGGGMGGGGMGGLRSRRL
jgi:hypothetical protein